MSSADDRIDERALSKLRWRCRRGLLENDLFIERFFRKYEHVLTQRRAAALARLMELSDPDLLDLLMARKSLQDLDPALLTDANQELLNLLKDRQP